MRRKGPKEQRQGGRFRRHIRSLLATLLIGVLIEVALLVMHANGLLGKSEDIGADVFMRLYSGVRLKEQGVAPFAYIDIDDETYVQWGEPLLTPRDKLATLLQLAIEAGAVAVIVDLDLSWGPASGDAELAAFFAHYGRQMADDASAKQHRPSKPPIILTRSLRSPKTEPTSIYPRLRRAGLDDIVAATPGVFWAAFRFTVQSDMVVRQWRLWEVTCVNGAVRVLPSVQLLILALLKAPVAGSQELQNALAAIAPRDCTMPMQLPAHASIQFGGMELRLFQDTIERRILFTTPWQLPPGHDRPRVFLNNAAVPLLTIIPAHRLTETEHPISPEMLRDRIVVIGGSHSETRDMYLTPLGPMPGAMVLINAMHTSLQYGALRFPPTWHKFLLGFGLVLAVSLCFHFFHLGVATIVALVLVCTSTIILSVRWLEFGIWLDATIPTLGVILHRWAAVLEHGWRSRGHRAFLSDEYRESANGPAEVETRRPNAAQTRRTRLARRSKRGRRRT